MRFQRALLSAAQFRQQFDFGNWDLAKWFPGHMAKGLRQMKANLKKVDCIIEVHDARVPLSGRNPLFHESLGIKPHLLVLNKMDLADLTEKQRILSQLKQQGVTNVIFTDCLRQIDENVKKVVPQVTKLIQSSERFHRMENLEYCLMVIGIPNVGKSSLINAMRRLHLKKGKASKVGGEPGITKTVLCRIQVCEKPPVFLLDTPGVSSPRVESWDVGLKLALCGTILDHLVGEDIIADYLLYILNKHQKFSYVEKYELVEPCDDLQTVLKRIAVQLGKTQKVKAITGVGDISILIPNYSAAAYHFIRAFRRGELGQVMLD
ncbi:mitochondrial ribosome-associated GTPase 1 [Latimeria chalumnae]